MTQIVPSVKTVPTKLYLPYGSGVGNCTRTPFPPLRGSSRMGMTTQDATVHWFVRERTRAIAPYTNLILNYRGLSEEGRNSAESIVDEFFTEQEFYQFRTYLREHHGKDVRTEVLVTPVSAIRPDNTTRIGASRPFNRPSAAAEEIRTVRSKDSPGKDLALEFFHAGRGVYSGIIRLDEEPGYDLPFAVCGYYSLPTTGTYPGRQHEADAQGE